MIKAPPIKDADPCVKDSTVSSRDILPRIAMIIVKIINKAAISFIYHSYLITPNTRII